MFTCLASARLKNVTRWVRRFGVQIIAAALTFCTLLHLLRAGAGVHSGARVAPTYHSGPFTGLSATHTLTFTTAAAVAGLCKSALNHQSSIQLSDRGGGVDEGIAV